jgi:hypothetical protein
MKHCLTRITGFRPKCCRTGNAVLRFSLPVVGTVFVVPEYLLVNKHVINGTVTGIANLFILKEVLFLLLGRSVLKIF